MLGQTFSSAQHIKAAFLWQHFHACTAMVRKPYQHRFRLEACSEAFTLIAHPLIKSTSRSFTSIDLSPPPNHPLPPPSPSPNLTSDKDHQAVWAYPDRSNYKSFCCVWKVDALYYTIRYPSSTALTTSTMHRYTSAQARGLRTASPGVEQQQRVALRDRLNQTAASINSLGNSETSVAFYGTQAIPYTTSHRSPAVYVDKFGSPTTISTQPHRQISSSASPWKQTLPSFSGSQFQTASITSAAQTNRGFTITAPSSTATSTRVTSGNLGAATTSAATPYTVQSWRPGANQPSSGASVNSPPSVKHLTCYFWDKYGKCKWADEECLYAHFHTGKVAGGPVQVEIGRKYSLTVRLNCSRFDCCQLTFCVIIMTCVPSCYSVCALSLHHSPLQAPFLLVCFGLSSRSITRSMHTSPPPH